MSRRLSLVVTLAAVMLVVAACGGSDELVENIIESSGAGNVEVDIDDDTVNVTFTDEEGNEIVIGSGAGVPAGFPVPVAAGGSVLASVDTPDETGVTLQYSEEAYDAVVAEYEAWLADQGYDDLQVSSSDGAGFKSAQWFTPIGGIFIAVGQSGGMTTVTINVNK